jgi:hypothetical protein
VARGKHRGLDAMLVRILRTAFVSVVTLVLLAITLLYCSCRPHTQDVKESTLIREFFQTHDSEQQLQEFRKHNLDEQYDQGDCAILGNLV